MDTAFRRRVLQLEQIQPLEGNQRPLVTVIDREGTACDFFILDVSARRGVLVLCDPQLWVQARTDPPPHLQICIPIDAVRQLWTVAGKGRISIDGKLSQERSQRCYTP